MRADGLAKTPLRPREIGIPSVLQCELLICVTKLALKTRGLGWSLGWLRKHVEAVLERTPVGVEAAVATEHAVAMAGALYPGRALCLEQSLVLYYLLRRRGAAVKLRMGVQAHPFLAHAWIDYRGAPLNDVLEHVKQFVLLPDQLS